VAGAIFAAASAAQAGIIIPAGDWTIDIGGNVNSFYTHKKTDLSGSATVGSTIYGGSGSLTDGNTTGTGLLPAAFGIGAKTRQNDLDVAFQFSFFTGTSSGPQGAAGALGTPAGGSNTLNIRQAYLTFGDKSWGQFKLGRDLGVFGSDAILSDMTLLGVGVSAIGSTAAGGNSTLGRIGSGYIYADWVGQIQYQTPNFSGFQVTAAVSEPLNNGRDVTVRNDMGYEAKATYDFAASDVTGRVWVGGISQKHNSGLTGSDGANGYTSRGAEVGAKLAVHDLGLVGYYYDGKGLDNQLNVGGIKYGNGFKSDDRGGYVQATYVLPFKTKLGASWGRNESEGNVSATVNGKVENESWIIGAYHPLTKHLNLVAEYTNQEIKGDARTRSSGATANGKIDSDTYSLGAILFF
jgi:predicted porin